MCFWMDGCVSVEVLICGIFLVVNLRFRFKVVVVVYITTIKFRTLNFSINVPVLSY